MRLGPFTLALLTAGLLARPYLVDAQSPNRRPEAAGGPLYESACAACHGVDGKGAPRDVVGFDTPLPDFTDCRFTTVEATADWLAVVHEGGPARGRHRRMPAFGEALTGAEIARVLDFVRGFCVNPRWPIGDLNTPRPLATEKAFPEDDALMATVVPATGDPDSVENEFIYERRVGARSQVEIVVPFNFRHTVTGWHRGFGDLTVGAKHALIARRSTIVSAAAEMTFPTGDVTNGLGRRLRILEPSALVGWIGPADLFVHGQAGLEFPLNIGSANDEAFWRIALGRTFTAHRFGRAWSPMVELLGSKELAADERYAWQLLPQLHVTLSRRQHVAVSGGIVVPLNAAGGRTRTATMSLLWDWRDGSFFSGW